MYIETGGARYPCTGYRPGTDEVRFLLGEEVPAELGEEVALLDDDGFELVRLRVADWARWEASSGALVLTDRPETQPAPAPEPEEPAMTLQEAIMDMLADHEYRLSLQELGLTDEGGAT